MIFVLYIKKDPIPAQKTWGRSHFLDLVDLVFITKQKLCHHLSVNSSKSSFHEGHDYRYIDDVKIFMVYGAKISNAQIQ